MSIGRPQTPYNPVMPGAAAQKFWLGEQEFAYAYKTYLTAALPTPASVGAGGSAWVSDATSRTFGAAPTGGGRIIVPVWTDGITWYIG